MKNEYMISPDRAIEILNPKHREDYPNMDEIDEACRMGMEALQELRDRENADDIQAAQAEMAVYEAAVRRFGEHAQILIAVEEMAELDALQGLGLGYRDKYLAELARDVMLGRFRPDKLQDMSTDEARRYLKSVRGIGDKVANCILLFGLGRHDAFPVDTWMKKIIDREYGGKFPLERYSGTAGVIQQYMFYAERTR